MDWTYIIQHNSAVSRWLKSLTLTIRHPNTQNDSWLLPPQREGDTKIRRQTRRHKNGRVLNRDRIQPNDLLYRLFSDLNDLGREVGPRFSSCLNKRILTDWLTEERTSGYATWFTAGGAIHIALRQILQNRKLRHLWRHNLGSRWKLQKMAREFYYWCVLQYNQKSAQSDQNCRTR